VSEAVEAADSDRAILRPPAMLETFGFQDTRCDVELMARSQSWRMTRALLSILVCWGLLPVVALLPPHFPWAIGAFIAGIVLAQRRLTERYTLRAASGCCPKCQAPIVVSNAGRLRRPQPVQCESCAQDLVLHVRFAD
jgi:hypothetical protein